MWLMVNILNSTCIYTFLNWENSVFKKNSLGKSFWECTTLKILTLNILDIKKTNTIM